MRTLCLDDQERSVYQVFVVVQKADKLRKDMRTLIAALLLIGFCAAAGLVPVVDTEPDEIFQGSALTLLDLIERAATIFLVFFFLAHPVLLFLKWKTVTIVCANPTFSRRPPSAARASAVGVCLQPWPAEWGRPSSPPPPAILQQQFGVCPGEGDNPHPRTHLIATPSSHCQMAASLPRSVLA